MGDESLRIISINADQRRAWNDFVARAPHFALMQSYEWGEFKERLGWQAIRLAALRHGQIVAAAQMLIKPVPLGLLSVAYIPRGPLVDWDDRAAATALLDALHRQARRRRAIFLKIEPALPYSPQAEATLADYGLRPSPYTNQPRATLTLDLTPDLDTILGQMRKKTRQRIRRAARRGLTVRFGDHGDLDAFYQMIRQTGQRRGFSPHNREYFEQEWQIFASRRQMVLLLASFQGRLLAGRTVHIFGRRAAEFHAAMSGEHTDLFPNDLLVWEAIKLAKEQGCTTYDLWGIPAEVGQAAYEGNPLPGADRTDGQWGLYRFKSGFGKQIEYYVHGHDYVYAPLLYKVMTNRFLNEDIMDRIARRLNPNATGA